MHIEFETKLLNLAVDIHSTDLIFLILISSEMCPESKLKRFHFASLLDTP